MKLSYLSCITVCSSDFYINIRLYDKSCLKIGHRPMHDFKRKQPLLVQPPVHLMETVANWDYHLLTVED
jgi:hypothetical protein